MPKYRKASFWIQGLAITAGTFAGGFLNDKMGGNWSIWHRFAMRLGCLAVAVGVVTVVGIVNHLPTRRPNRISN
jgi:hypothetical protein